MIWCLAVILIGLQIFVSNGINYCGSRMCGHTNEHTFCRYPHGPGPACAGYMSAPLSVEEKSRVISRLNRRRRDVALGLNDWPPAGDMLKLRWVEELSREAQLWADQCWPPSQPEEHDLCRDLYSVTVGQCVASIIGEAPGLRPETMVDIWYMQRISYDGNFTFYVQSANNYYGDFAQMIWSRVYMVGCSRSRFMSHWHGRIRSIERLVCNFAPRGPIPSRPLWAPGAPASMCPVRSQPDRDIPGLCTYLSENDINASPDVDQRMTPQEQLLLNTVLEIENNETLDYTGGLDELYLKRLAISTIESSYITESNFDNYIHKREVIGDIGLDENGGKNILKTETTTKNPITLVTLGKTVTKKKINLVGRPKSYNLEDLEDETTIRIIKNDIPEDITERKDLYVDLEYTDQDNYNDVASSSTEMIAKTNVADTTEELVPENKLLNTTAFEIIQNKTDNSENVNRFYWNTSWIFNVSTPSLNNTINDTVLDDYLSDPETFKQLQEALERMENSLSTQVTPIGKVRREIRNPDENGHLLKRRRNNIPPEELLALERNRTKERGPMLSMVMKYLPYLRPYEKTILGEEVTNGVRRIMPSIILLLVLCM